MITSVSGGASGALEIIFTYPFEFAKTQQQLYPKTYAHMNFVKCWGKVYNEFGGFPKGYFALYRGMAPLIAFGIPRNGCRFTAFEFTRAKLQSAFPEMGTVPTHMIAGLAGGFSEAVLVTTYQETMKVRLIHDRLSEKPRFRNSFHGVRTILQEQGFRGVYKGLVPTIAKQGSNQMIRFPVYYYMKTMLVGNPDDDFSKNGVVVGNLQAMAVGGIAGAASVLGNTPVDVIKTKMQGLDSARYNGVVDVVKQTIAEEGVAGLYKGMGARMGRVTADVALTFFFMEKVKMFIKSIWT